MNTVAALYVLSNSSPYAKIEGVDLWPERRDARLYPGPWPVIAHPPCGPWSRKWSHACGDRLRAMMHLAVCAALQVRRFSGCLEHPAGSRLWDKMSLPRPVPVTGEDPPRDFFGGFSFEVELGWFGFPSRKPTWLYFCGISPAATWASLPAAHIPPRHDGGTRSDCDRPRSAIDEMSQTARRRTPPAMARWLADLIRNHKE